MNIRVPGSVAAMVIIAGAALTIGLFCFSGGEETGAIVRGELLSMHGDANHATCAAPGSDSTDRSLSELQHEPSTTSRSSDSDRVAGDGVALSGPSAGELEVSDEKPVSSGLRIEPGTPVEFTSVYYLRGHVPVEIRVDGTQVYDDIPMRVRKPDGTFEVRRATMSIKPQPALPMAAPSSAPEAGGIPSAE